MRKQADRQATPRPLQPQQSAQVAWIFKQDMPLPPPPTFKPSELKWKRRNETEKKMALFKRKYGKFPLGRW